MKKFKGSFWILIILDIIYILSIYIVLTGLYNWFVVPNFPTAPAFNSSIFFGIYFIYSIFKGVNPLKKSIDYKEPIELIINNIVNVWVVYFSAFIVTLLI